MARTGAEACSPGAGACEQVRSCRLPIPPVNVNAMHSKTLRHLFTGAALAAAADRLPAQANGLRCNLIDKADDSVSGREAVAARVDVAPGGRAGRHTHPADEIRYGPENEIQVLIEGRLPHDQGRRSVRHPRRR